MVDLPYRLCSAKQERKLNEGKSDGTRHSSRLFLGWGRDIECNFISCADSQDPTCQYCFLKRWADSTLPKEAAVICTKRGLPRFWDLVGYKSSCSGRIKEWNSDEKGTHGNFEHCSNALLHWVKPGLASILPLAPTSQLCQWAQGSGLLVVTICWYAESISPLCLLLISFSDASVLQRNQD